MNGTLGTHTVGQVGFIVRDLEKAKRDFAAFLGTPVPENCDGGRYEITKTTVDGTPAPDANCTMAFFDAGGSLQIELIQPNGVKSAWQDFLDEHGEGIHHIAFQVKGMDEKVLACEELGMRCLQRGKYGSGSGEYAYVDGGDRLKCVLELLESY